MGEGNYGQKLAFEEEIKRKVNEELARHENKKEAKNDTDEQALEAFTRLREATPYIDYDRVSDDDVLADAMKVAKELKTKKMIMRYKRLRQECLLRDKLYANRVLNNMFTQLKKAGNLQKRNGGFFGSWTPRFAVLSNAGLVYFKPDSITASNSDEFEP